MNDSEILQNIKKGDSKTLKEIYLAYRKPFLVFGKKYSTSEEVILDVYQDAIIAFQEQVMKGKADNLNCTLKTYLFGIGKYMIFDKNRKSNKEVSMFTSEVKDDYDVVEVEDFSNPVVSLQQKQIQKALSLLGKKCKEVLTLFYYNNLTIEEIKEYLNYDNKNVVKSQKSRCLKQLKSKVNG
ncbi:sigma-70 family RNA polymerase sigma factor [uncultured Tenacibaculum sp.]|uniref:RNA polymerase sigma factor n=1 Tax=uncultured Tenacibaculum sp. TaxID=174713 RepID=UPI002617C49C|nr:sigma-70 family RNA polymerase sigma factor [uncultured Tenacibaculum sp.]